MVILENILNAVFNVSSWQDLLINLVICAGIFIVFKIISAVSTKKLDNILSKIFKRHNQKLILTISKSLYKPLKIFFVATGIYLALIYVPFAVKIETFLVPILHKIYRISILISISIFLQSFIGNIPLFSEKFSDPKNKTVFTFFLNIGKVLVVVLTVVILLNEFNYDINGLIAGIGLGGLTFALAAQDTASNFFSGLVILFDKPFGIGDWISTPNLEGVVEEINFRSCRIRTFDNALIAVPNSKLSNDILTNWTKMNLRKTKITIGLIYSTKRETLQKVCSEIKENLLKYPEIKSESILVWFDNFNSSSLDVIIQYHSFPIALSEHVQLKQKVQYMIMEVVENNDTDFAFDTKTIVFENQQ